MTGVAGTFSLIRFTPHNFSHPLEISMKIENAVVLITGANRGIGLAFARELLARDRKSVV